jgi:hypothetical protein
MKSIKTIIFIIFSLTIFIGFYRYLTGTSVRLLDLKQMKVQELFENSIESFDTHLLENDSLIIVLIRYPDC